MTWWFVGSSCSNCGHLWWPFSWTRRTEPPNRQCNLFRSIILATHHLFHVLLQRPMPCEVLQKWKLAPASHVVFNDQSPRRIVCKFFQSIYTHVFMYILYIDISTCIYVHHIFFRCKSPHFCHIPGISGRCDGLWRFSSSLSSRWLRRSTGEEPWRWDLFNPRGHETTHIGIQQGKSQVILSDLPINIVYWCVLFWWVIQWPL